MYVAMTLLQVGIGLHLASVAVVVLAPVSMVGVLFTAILPEEAYLREAFGESYTDYCDTVGRWV